MLPIQLGVTARAADSNGSLAHLFFNLNLLGRVLWRPAANDNGCFLHAYSKFLKSVSNGHYYCTAYAVGCPILADHSAE